MQSWMQQAREAAHLSPETCANSLGLSQEDYEHFEQNPGLLTIDQVGAFSADLNERGRDIVLAALRDAAWK